jgi:hypothetical protein
MGSELLGKVGRGGAAATGKRKKLVQGLVHAVGALAAIDRELEAVLVGGILLLLRELRSLLRDTVLHSLHRRRFPCDPRYLFWLMYSYTS